LQKGDKKHIEKPERRHLRERRRRLPYFSIQYWLGGRRVGGRRVDDQGNYVDKYEAGLVSSAVAILVLCSVDAVLTLVLITRGATEINIAMAKLISIDVASFLYTKILVTAIGVIILIMHKNHYYFRLIRVKTLVHLFLVFYVFLVGYEIVLLQISSGY
jgi:Domain of unknown function (DUF5658)